MGARGVKNVFAKFGIDVPSGFSQHCRTIMPATFAPALRACCAAVALLLLSVRAAEPVSPLIGVTMEQVITRYGEPKSQIVVGNRIVMFYPRERIVVREGRVIEVEQITAEPVRRSEPPSGVPANPGANAASGPGPAGGVPPGKAGELTAPGVATPGMPAGIDPATGAPLPPAEPRVEIKLVRLPSANAGRGATAPVPPPVAAPIEPVVEPPEPKVQPGPPKPDPAALAAAAARAAELAAQNKRAKAASSAVRRLDFAEGSALEDESTPMWRYALLVVVAIGGVGFFVWRRRQADLLATSVENTPVRAPSSATTTSVTTPPMPMRPRETLFAAEFLSGLDEARFESLVAAYYVKTGVVAARANAGDAGPALIRISWKGEPRPFAGVLCLAQPRASIDATPLRELAAALAQEDIRRGHVVTTGKFTAAARDFAAENQLTLLPGDAFREKLNALPNGARAEIMDTVTSAGSAA